MQDLAIVRCRLLTSFLMPVGGLSPASISARRAATTMFRSETEYWFVIWSQIPRRTLQKMRLVSSDLFQIMSDMANPAHALVGGISFRFHIGRRRPAASDVRC